MVIFLSEQLVENSMLIKMSSTLYTLSQPMYNFNKTIILICYIKFLPMIINFYFCYIRLILEK